MTWAKEDHVVFPGLNEDREPILMKTDLAKLTVPSIGRVLQRPRLFRLLDRTRKSQPIIWITGPPGSGKTTLAASYVSHKKIPCLWYRIDEGDSDLASFFHYLGLAVAKPSKRTTPSLPKFFPEFLPHGLSAFTRRFFRQLYNRKGPSCVLVLDNYHDVAISSPLHRVIREGLEEMSAGWQTMIVSRAAPSQEFIRHQVSRQLGVLEAEDLKLTRTEAKAIAKIQTRRPIATQVFREMYEKTNGWVGGLILCLDHWIKDAPGLVTDDQAVQETIFNYLAEELFQKLDRHTQQFLLKSACLPTVTGQLGKELTGIPYANEILESLHRNNFFTDRRKLRDTFTYQYHDLFRDFLLDRARTTLKPAMQRRVQSQAAELLATSGQFEPAMELYVQAKNWEGVSHLLQQVGHAFHEQGRYQTMSEWLNHVPLKEIEKDPWLLYWSGMAGQPVNPKESIQKFDRAFKGFWRRKDRLGTYASLVSGLNTIFHESLDFTQFDMWFTRLEKLQSVAGKCPDPMLENFLITNVFWAMFWRKPDHPQFSHWLDQAYTLFEITPNPELQVLLGQFLGAYFSWIGDLHQAEHILNRVSPFPRIQQVSPLTDIPDKITRAQLAWLSIAPQECLDIAKEGLEISKASGVQLWVAQLYGMQACSYLSHGELKGGKHTLELMAEFFNMRPSLLDQSFYHVVAGWKALLEGNYQSAVVSANEGTRASTQVGIFHGFAVEKTLLAWAFAGLGEYKKAKEAAQQAIGRAQRMGSALLEWMGRLAQVQVALKGGLEREAKKTLHHALALGKEKGLLNCFFWQPKVMTELCQQALEWGIESEYAHTLIQKRGLVVNPPSCESEHWPWRLKIFTLGQFRVEQDGEAMRWTGKAPQRPLALLKALIAFGGNEVKETQLTDALWPDAEGDAAHKSFSVTLTRLRTLLGVDGALELSGGNLSLNSQLCWVDTCAFEELVNGVFAKSTGGHPKKLSIEANKQLERALSLYQGPFLGETPDEAWALPLHDRLHRLYVQTQLRLEKRGEKSRM